MIRITYQIHLSNTPITKLLPPNQSSKNLIISHLNFYFILIIITLIFNYHLIIKQFLDYPDINVSYPHNRYVYSLRTRTHRNYNTNKIYPVSNLGDIINIHNVYAHNFYKLFNIFFYHLHNPNTNNKILPEHPIHPVNI